MLDSQESLFSRHTQLEEMRVINWGVFNNPGPITFATEPNTGCITMISGHGGSGKSNLIDALMFVLGNPRQNDFNKRAGSSASGRNPRTAYTYVRGYVKDRGGRPADNYLRGTNAAGKPVPCWSAVSVTAIGMDGTRHTMARFAYINAGSTECNSSMWAFAPGKFDIGLAEKAAVRGLSIGTLKEVLGPNVIVKDSGAAIQALWQEATGCTPDSSKLHRLLNNPKDLRTPTDVFRNLNENETESVDMAKKIVESYDNYIEAEKASERKIRLYDDIDELTQRYEAKADLDRSLATLSPWTQEGRPSASDKDILCKWIVSKKIDILNDAVKTAAANLEEKRVLSETANRNEAEQSTKVSDLKRQINAFDTHGALADKEKELAHLNEMLAVRTRQRQGILRVFTSVGEALPSNPVDWAMRRSKAQRAENNYNSRKQELENTNIELSVAVRDAKTAVEDAKSKLSNAQKTRSRIGNDLTSDLDRIKHATGLSDDAIVYEAQLFDLNENHEKWRTAMNAAWGGEARTILIDGDESEFREKIEQISMNRRVHYRFVDIDKKYQPFEPKAETLSSFLRFDEASRFAPYVKNRLAGKLDYVCVENVSQLVDDDIPQLTINGQAKKKNEGWYGKSGAEIIGFIDEAYIQQLSSNLENSISHLSEVEAKRHDIVAEISMLEAEKSIWNAVSDVDFSDIDTDGTSAKIRRIEDEMAKLRQNPKLDALICEKDAEEEVLHKLKGQADEARTNLRMAENEYNQLTNTSDRLTKRLDGFSEIRQRDGEAPWNKFDEELEGLALSDKESVRMLTSEEALTQKAEKITDNIVQEREHLRDDISTAYKKIIQQMEKIKRDDLTMDEATGIGSDIGSYPAYLNLKKGGDAKKEQASLKAHYLAGTAVEIANFLTAKESYKHHLRTQAEDFNNLLKKDKFEFRDTGEHLELEVLFDESADNVQLGKLLRTFTDNDFFQNGSGGYVGDVNYYKSIGDNKADLKLRRLKKITSFLRENNCRSAFTDPRLSMRVDASLYKVDDGVRHKTEKINFAGNNGSKFERLTTCIVAAAICFAVKHTGGLPNYAPMFMDESFVLSDDENTEESIKLLKELGFQVILSCPDQKRGAIGPYAKKIYLVRRYQKNDGPSSIINGGDVREYDETDAV